MKEEFGLQCCSDVSPQIRNVRFLRFNDLRKFTNQHKEQGTEERICQNGGIWQREVAPNNKVMARLSFSD